MLNAISKAIRTTYGQRLSKLAAIGVISSMPLAVYAAEENKATEEEVEKITVVGSQIRGGQMSEALAVSVMSSEDIAELGIDSGDELLDLIPENGQNFFNEAENISGGVNAARGDVGAFNLRNLGTGNTLVLLNGRRVVNAASYQTEEVGGSFVPVNTVNSNSIPVVGMERVEVLRDGASAIYGADAVAGVVNYVLKNDFEGFNIRAKLSEYEHLPASDKTLTMEMGKSFNDGKTNVSAFFNYYSRDRVSSLDDARWSSSDLIDRLPEGSPWADGTEFRNSSANSLFGKFDIVPGNEGDLDNNGLVDRGGEFHVYPINDPACANGYQLSEYTCGISDDDADFYRHDFNAIGRDLRSDLTRGNLFVFVNHEFENGMESFTEFSFYKSETNTVRHSTAAFSTSELVVPAENYYNPFGVAGSDNRLPESVTGDFTDAGFDIVLDNYRFAELPRIVDNDGDSVRLLQGLRGDLGDWSWEAAVSYSKAEKLDITHNRVSNTLMQEALNKTTPDAYNPFSGGINSNIEQALIDVTRRSETELTTVDAKFSNPDLFELPGGSVGGVFGFEFRNESFIDDRDDRLDGTIQFIDKEGDTYPYVSDVVNSSPTPDNKGERDVTSVFGELHLPLHDTLDMQVALRYEDFSDVGDTTVGKVAFGWRPSDMVLVRGSWSEAFRAPNLVTVNEAFVARSNGGQIDWTCMYALDNASDADAAESALGDCEGTIQRTAEGSVNLKPETSDNTSIGLVLTPTENLTVTLDYWTIEKENTIGLFGSQNHTLLDLYERLSSGEAQCTTNPIVVRDEADADQAAIYQDVGLCAAGDIKYVGDQYANLDTRTVSGHDIGVYYDLDTKFGNFNFRFNASYLDKFEQKAGNLSADIEQGKAEGLIPAEYFVEGLGDLINRNGNQDKRYSFKLSWRKNAWGASLSGNHISDFYDADLTMDDENGNELRYVIPSMTTYNATLDYRFEAFGADMRTRFGIKNLTDERAPLADGYFGFFSDAHRDYGRNYYVDVRMSF